jgi:hypothetical protein
MSEMGAPRSPREAERTTANTPFTVVASRGIEPGILAGLESGLAVFPVFDGERLVALLYLDGREIEVWPPHDLGRLLSLSRSLVRSAPGGAGRPSADWDDYLERTPLRDIQRRKLFLLLEQNEWNISRVARILEVTRRTIYLRLQRYGIPRQRVRKTPRRPA